tara:strand:+ start:202 stop:549 length:348 start_codon:yes stop_codon:yes gene_type:complete
MNSNLGPQRLHPFDPLSSSLCPEEAGRGPDDDVVVDDPPDGDLKNPNLDEGLLEDVEEEDEDDAGGARPMPLLVLAVAEEAGGAEEGETCPELDCAATVALSSCLRRSPLSFITL